MDETMDMMGGIGSMGSPEQAAAFKAFKQTDPNTLNQEILGASMEAAPAEMQGLISAVSSLGMSPEEVDSMIMAIDALLMEPQKYAENRAELISGGADPALFPEEFDYQYLTGLRIALQALQSPMPTAQGFAKGGIAELKPIARAMAKMGRGGDSQLVHVNPTEMAMLKRMGGVGTRNPYTGLREYGFFKSIGKAISNVGKAVTGAVKGVVNTVKDFVKSDIGRIVTTVALGVVLGPAAVSILGASAPAWAVAGLSGAMAGAGATLLAGGSLKDALKAGLTAGVTAGVSAGLFQGFDTAYTGPKTYGELFGTTPTPVPGAPTPDVAPGATDFVFDDVTGEMIPNPAAQIQPVSAPIEGVSATQGVMTPGTVSAQGGGFTFDPATGEMIPTDFAASQGIMPNAQVMPVQAGGPQITELAAQGGLSPSGGQFMFDEFGNQLPTDYALNQGMAPPPQPVDMGMGSGVRLGGPTTAPAPGVDYGLVPSQPAPTNYLTQQPNMARVPTSYGTSPVGTAAQAGTQVAAAPQPGYFETMYDKLSQGDVSGALNETWNRISPSQIAERGNTAAIAKADAAIAGMNPNAPATMAKWNAVYEAAKPGMISTYAPIVGVGTGIAALSGGFKKEPPPSPQLVTGPTGIDLYQQDPSAYRPNIYAGQTDVSYRDVNPMYYQQQQYGYYNPFAYRPRFTRSFSPMMFAAKGGIADLEKFPRKTGPIDGPGTGTSDSIPAMLSDGEFVFTAKAVRGMGNGSRRKGAKKMYKMMKLLEKRAGGEV